MVDVSLRGWDNTWADGVDVYLFSGHGTGNGSDNYLGLSTPGWSPTPNCNSHAESGTTQEVLFDQDAELAFFDVSCGGSVPERHAVWYEGGGNGMMIDLKQGFAFRNSPSDTQYRYWKFMIYSGQGMSNKDAWLEAGDGCYLLFCDDESPIVFTKGNTATQAQSRANNMNMSNFQSYSTPTGNYYWYYSINNGEC